MAPRSQEPQKQKQVTKYKYYCTFKLNVKGEKKELAYIIEADNIDETQKLAQLRTKKEFTGIRSFTCFKSRTANEDDKEYIRNIEETSNVSITESNKITNIDKESLSQDELEVQNMLEDLPEDLKNTQMWKVVYTPGKKPRKKDYDKHYFVVFGDTREEALAMAKVQLDDMNIKFKEKWAVLFPINAKDIANSKLYKEFKESRPDLVMDLSNTAKTNNDIRATVKEKANFNIFLDFKDVRIELDKDGNISGLDVLGVNIITKGTFTKFILTPIISLIDKQLQPITVYAPDLYNAVFFLYIALKQNDVPRIYKQIDTVKIFDDKTQKTSTSNYGNLSTLLNLIIDRELNKNEN